MVEFMLPRGFQRKKSEQAAKLTSQSIEEKARRLQGAFPNAEKLLQERISVLEKSKRPLTEVSGRSSSFMRAVYATPLIGGLAALGSTTRRFGELIKGTSDRAQHADVDVEIRMERATFEAAKRTFNIAHSQKPGPLTGSAKKVLSHSLKAWEDAEIHSIQFPSDADGAILHHQKTWKVLRVAAEELGMFELFDTEIKRRLDLNIPELGKFALLGLATEAIKSRMPQYNAYIAAMENKADPDGMIKRFNSIAEATPVRSKSPRRRLFGKS